MALHVTRGSVIAGIIKIRVTCSTSGGRQRFAADHDHECDDGYVPGMNCFEARGSTGYAPYSCGKIHPGGLSFPSRNGSSHGYSIQSLHQYIGRLQMLLI
jgi:hypothetical protein